MLSSNEAEFIRIKKMDDQAANEFANRKYEGFPYVVTVQSDYYTLDEMEDWCWENVGFIHGKCNREHCDMADIDSDCYGETFIRLIHNWRHGLPVDFDKVEYFTIFGIPRKIVEETLTDSQRELLKLKEPKHSPEQMGYRNVHFDELDIDGLIQVIKEVDEHTIDEIIMEACWDESHWYVYDHSHVGDWKIQWLGKTGYDYGFCDFQFRNLKDAILFRMLHDVK